MQLEFYRIGYLVLANPFPFFESSVNLSVLANFANSGLKTRLSKLCKIHAAMHKLLVAQERSSAIIGAAGCSRHLFRRFFRFWFGLRFGVRSLQSKRLSQSFWPIP